MIPIIKVQLLIAKRLDVNRPKLSKNKRRKTSNAKRCSRKTKSKKQNKKRQWSNELKIFASRQKLTPQKQRNSKIFSSKKSRSARTDKPLRRPWRTATKETSLRCLERLWRNKKSNPRKHVKKRWCRLSQSYLNSFMPKRTWGSHHSSFMVLSMSTIIRALRTSQKASSCSSISLLSWSKINQLSCPTPNLANYTGLLSNNSMDNNRDMPRWVNKSDPSPEKEKIPPKW